MVIDQSIYWKTYLAAVYDLSKKLAQGLLTLLWGHLIYSWTAYTSAQRYEVWKDTMTAGWDKFHGICGKLMTPPFLLLYFGQHFRERFSIILLHVYIFFFVKCKAF